TRTSGRAPAGLPAAHRTGRERRRASIGIPPRSGGGGGPQGGGGRAAIEVPGNYRSAIFKHRLCGLPPPPRMTRRLPRLTGEASDYLMVEYLKLGESLAKIGIVTLSLIDQTISW